MGNDLSPNVYLAAPPEWISARIETLLSHYFKPETDEKIEAAAMVDWIKALSPYSKSAISGACDRYLREEALRRPTPAALIQRIDKARGMTAQPVEAKDRRTLTADEAFTLNEKVLPMARQWVKLHPPGSPLYEHGLQTLAYWGERV